MNDTERDAAALLKSVHESQSTVRRFTEPGTIADFFVIVLAQSAARWLAPTKIGYSGPRIALSFVGLIGLVGFTLIAAAMFAASAAINVTMHGDARETALTLIFGAALIALGVAYRRYLAVLLGGAAAIAAGGDAIHWPIAAWAVPLLVWVAVFGYLGRNELKS